MQVSARSNAPRIAAEHSASSSVVSVTTQRANVKRQKRVDLFARFCKIWTLAALFLCQLRRTDTYGDAATSVNGTMHAVNSSHFVVTCSFAFPDDMSVIRLGICCVTPNCSADDCMWCDHHGISLALLSSVYRGTDVVCPSPLPEYLPPVHNKTVNFTFVMTSHLSSTEHKCSAENSNATVRQSDATVLILHAPFSDQATTVALHPTDHPNTPAASHGTMTDGRNTGQAIELPATTFPNTPPATNALPENEDTHPVTARVPLQQLSSNESTPDSVSSALVTDSAYFQATRAATASPTSASKTKISGSAQAARSIGESSSAVVLWWTFGALAVVTLVVGAGVSLFISRRRIVLTGDQQWDPRSAPTHETVGAVGCNSNHAHQLPAEAEPRTAPNTGVSVCVLSGIAAGGMGGNNCVPKISVNAGSHSPQSDTSAVIGNVSGRSGGAHGNDHLPLPSVEAGAHAVPGSTSSAAVSCDAGSSDCVSRSSADTGFRDAPGGDSH